MIITSVFAGPKKYKTVTFDLFPFPLSYAVPNNKQFAYRGHYTFKRPNFNVDLAMPVTIPLNFDHVTPNIGFNNDANQEYSNEEQSEHSYEENNEDSYSNSNTHAEEEYNIDNSNAEADSAYSSMDANTDSNMYKLPPSREKLPAYILNGENDIKSPMTDVGVGVGSNNNQNAETVLPNANKYAGYDSDANEPRPYTGKAQVSSFIDNGQFVNAHSPVVSKTPAESFANQPVTAHRISNQYDTSYSDERSSNGQTSSRRDSFSPRRSSDMSDMSDIDISSFGAIDRSGMMVPTLTLGTFPAALTFPIAEKIYAAKEHEGKTISMGYNTKAEEPTHHPITTHARHPDSLPYGMTDYSDIQKYYTTFQFTDQFRGPLISSPWPKKKRLFSSGFINLG